MTDNPEVIYKQKHLGRRAAESSMIRYWQARRVDERLVEGDDPGWIGDSLAPAKIAEKLLRDGNVPAILTPGGRPSATSGLARFGIAGSIEVCELNGRAFSVGVHDKRLTDEGGEIGSVGIATLARAPHNESAIG